MKDLMMGRGASYPTALHVLGPAAFSRPIAADDCAHRARGPRAAVDARPTGGPRAGRRGGHGTAFARSAAATAGCRAMSTVFGRKIARQNAAAKIWRLEGYLLKQRAPSVNDCLADDWHVVI
ncbi:Gp49 family protein [Burkholderia gladioli]|uniref:Gp49 family protein n=1 Tax=Burkholderia gladioli TaxID=28095 RepID=UPI003EDEAD8B